ncbi:unnamed protein product [Dovyalis caffra]|uniref:Uncharacterized protein n=1 Tax=Dovyalis caffra TaxID=77055 RepID=A0AAV1S740_9ROSI|nr:unnamed protein product [Dovyalis caffra]
MEQPSNSSKKQRVSIFGLFIAADNFDYLLMFFETADACAHGAVLPVFFILFGHMIDSMGHLGSDPQKMFSQVSKYSLYIVYLGLGVFVAGWIGVASWMQTGERQTARLRLKYLQSVLKKDMNFFNMEARDSNILFHISSDAILVQDAIGDKGMLFVTFLSSSLDLPLDLHQYEKGEAAYAEAGKVADEAISQIRTIYSFVREQKAIEAYSKSLKNALKLGEKSGFAKGIGIGSTYGLLFCSWAQLLWYASILIRRGDTNGIINVIFSGFARGQAAPNIAAISKGRAAAVGIISMIETDSNPSKNLKNGIMLPKVSGQIEFCEVCFAYPSRSNMDFESLSFSISAGKTFAVVGSSGSGKSTVISMVWRFYEPTSGKILLDGHDLQTLKLKWLREQMGLVSQEPALFATTIADNIMFGKEDASMDQVIEVAKATNVHSFVVQLPDGYHSQVGEGGTQLSGGQKQRITIARAVLKNPKILLLDEATSALDAESEHIVQQALDKIMSNRTTIVVAHRLSTIRDVDTIFVLKNGQVVESGNHLELISEGGEYAAMVSLQVSEHVTDASLIVNYGTDGNSSFRTPTNSQNYEFKSVTTKELKSNDENLSPANFSPTPSIWELVKLNAPEWPYAVLGSAGAILAGMEAPLFALGITHMLTAFYSPDISQMKKEVQLVALIFVGAAVITVPIYLLQHYFYTLMGERLMTRVRLSMFSAILYNEIGYWRISAVVIACFPLFIGAAITEQLFLKGFGGDYRSYAKANAVAREAIANIRTVASFGLGYGASQLFCLCAYALGLWYASVVISHKESNFDHVMKSFMVLVMTSYAIAETLALAPDIMKGSQALESVFSVLHRKTAMDPDDPTSKVVADIKGDVEFRHANFSLAVVGQSGSGKSTVIALILRFYDPISGIVLIDGHDIKTLNLKSLRWKIGLVQQEPALFSTTIYENIKYGNENASEIERTTVIRGAETENSNYKSNTKDPSILLLDEATNALDTASEKLVQEALDKLMEGRTTVLVAHRLSTGRDADSIAVLQHGRVVEIGSHNQLIGKPGDSCLKKGLDRGQDKSSHALALSFFR